MRKDRLDGFGALVLLGVTLMLAASQIMVKEVNSGVQPVFAAGVRSAIAAVCVTLWLVWRQRPPRIKPANIAPGLLIGVVFAAEFICLFTALDLTTVGRASVIFYSMPVWFALMAHVGLPGQRIGGVQAVGLAVAFAGTAWAILGGASSQGPGSLLGDLCALGGALGWAATAFLARASNLRHEGPEVQLWWMVLVSAAVLLAVAPAFGPLLRDVQPLHWGLLAFQGSAIAAGTFITWLWLLSVYPMATVASFSFLTPILSIALGHVIFGEPVTLTLAGSAALVAAGIVLINQRR